jgi:hypothetical protein
MAPSVSKNVYVALNLGSGGNDLAQQLRSARASGSKYNLLNVLADVIQGLSQYGFTLDVEVLGSDGTAASGTVTWTATAAHGAGTSNAAFTFLAAASGACTVTVGTHTGITITGSGTANTDALALKAAIDAACASDATKPVVTVNAGDVRMVWDTEGDCGNVATVVTATGGGKLSAAAATLTGGAPTGALGNVVTNGHTVALGSVTAGQTATQTAAAILALIQADAATSLLVNSDCAYSTDVVLTLTAKINPSIAEVGNKLTLTASVGTASGAVLAGGVNASASNVLGQL